MEHDAEDSGGDSTWTWDDVFMLIVFITILIMALAWAYFQALHALQS